MIFAYPQDLKKIKNFPVTFALLAANFFIYLLIFDRPDKGVKVHDILKTENLVLTARLYLQSVPDFTKDYQEQIPDWIFQLNRDNQEQMEYLGSYTLRDQYFLNFSESNYFFGDQVAIKEWKRMMKDFRRYKEVQPVFSFGLLAKKNFGIEWLTYQFSHSGFVHLLSNMAFLVLIGIAVEQIVGGLTTLLIYLLGGICGGLLFLKFNLYGALPMVGASASISALLAFYCVIEAKKRIRYFYFLSPLQGHYGYVYLSPLLIFPLFLLVDFTSLLIAPDGTTVGVAYSAHIGGTIFGIFTGLALRFLFPSRV